MRTPDGVYALRATVVATWRRFAEGAGDLGWLPVVAQYASREDVPDDSVARMWLLPDGADGAVYQIPIATDYTELGGGSA